MTENEAKWEYCRAIDLIKRIKTEETHERYIDRHKAFDFAIQALKEIQAYRAIGLTPELIEAMQGHNIALINDLGEYQKIGTIEEFKALKEKSEPKKPIERFTGSEWVCECPTCRGITETPQEQVIESIQHCAWCGQKLDWSEEGGKK